MSYISGKCAPPDVSKVIRSRLYVLQSSPPATALLLIPHRRIGGACRRDGNSGQVRNDWLNIFAIAARRRATIQQDARDARMHFEELPEIIRDLVPNIRIQAAFPATMFQHIPDRHALIDQDRPSCLIWQVRVRAEQVTHDLPERVSGMGIILASLQRSDSRHAAKNQHPGARADNRVEALNYSFSAHQTIRQSRE